MESEESRFQEGVRKLCYWNKISVNLNKNSTRHGHSWKRKVFKMCNDPHCWNSLGLLLFKNLWVPFSTETTDRAHFEANIHWRDVKMGCITSHNVCGHSWAVCSWTWSLTTRMMEKTWEHAGMWARLHALPWRHGGKVHPSKASRNFCPPSFRKMSTLRKT